MHPKFVLSEISAKHRLGYPKISRMLKPSGLRKLQVGKGAAHRKLTEAEFADREAMANVAPVAPGKRPSRITPLKIVL
jgi:hypothetical protein